MDVVLPYWSWYCIVLVVVWSFMVGTVNFHVHAIMHAVTLTLVWVTY
jgi:hypothetical protein